jgi:drug/metabolite transporter (DMT)-like permease
MDAALTRPILPEREAAMIAGIAVAAAAACCYEGAYVLQALEAREESGGARLQASLLRRLVRRPRWLFGTALSAVGALLQVFALTLAPLTVVQPTLALGLVLLLTLSATVLHEHVGRRELLGVTMVVCGVVLVAIMAPADTSKSLGNLATAVMLGLLGAVALLPFLLRRRLHDARLRVVAAAAGDAWAAIGLKLVADALQRHAWLPLIAWAVGAIAAGAIALTAEMSALQRIAATRVAPVVLAVQVLVPVIAGPLALDESWSGTPLDGVALGAAVLLVAAGAALLGASGAVAGTRASGEDSGGSGPIGGRGRGGGGPGDAGSGALGKQVEDDVGGEREARVRGVG